MKKYFPQICVVVFCMFPIFANASTKGEQCEYITEAMLEIAARGASDEALEKLKSKEVYDKAFTTCMSGTDRDVGELYNKLQ